MEVKEAVSLAKKEFNELFGGADVSHLALEEVDYDESKQEWLITLGFFRTWNEPVLPSNALSAFAALKDKRRIFKVVHIPEQENRKIVIKNREFEEPLAL